MIKAPGTLRVICAGADDADSALLVTEFGAFRIDEGRLEQFAKGDYDGTFWISEIYLSHSVTDSGAVIGLKARLNDMEIIVARPEAVGPHALHAASCEYVHQRARGELEASVHELFDVGTRRRLAARREVSLDVRTERSRLRAQVRALTRLGYEFVARRQVWIPDERTHRIPAPREG